MPALGIEHDGSVETILVPVLKMLMAALRDAKCPRQSVQEDLKA